jgi:branched-subunit amino acid aminotransferase/4-amino-4-deoxychorismate lyase
MPAGPRDAVFTTVLFQPGRGVADLDLHLARLQKHATALRLSPEMGEAQHAIARACQGRAEEGLVRLTWSSDGWTCTFRKRNAFTDVDAITVPAPRWAGRITGTKHGAWSWASEAADQGDAMGADAVLLVHEHRIVDERRSTPLLLDDDGVVWAAADDDGGVDSITLKTLMKGLSEAGLPLHRGHLNERRVARATAMVLVGTGLGVASVETIDGVPFASPSQRLFDVCTAAYTEHLNDVTAWTDLGGAL